MKGKFGGGSHRRRNLGAGFCSLDHVQVSHAAPEQRGLTNVPVFGEGLFENLWEELPPLSELLSLELRPKMMLANVLCVSSMPSTCQQRKDEESEV